MTARAARIRGVRLWLGSAPRAGLTAGVMGFVVAWAATMARGGLTAPRVQDEFSYLLASDTYASGRVTNPTPALPEHFETVHVLLSPTYASKYPPAQGLLLAVGQVLTGEPIVGVWLSFGLMCAAFTWMLAGWVRPGWALWGGGLGSLWLVGHQAIGAAFEPAFWATSYWGGALPATGAALVFGGLRRTLTRPRVPPALMMALGLGVLANSRPAEGLFVALVPCAVLAVWLLRSRAVSLAQRVRRVVFPMAVVLAAVGTGMAWLNYRVTGHPLRLPYVAYHARDATWQPFLGRAHAAGQAPALRFRKGTPEPGTGLGSVRRFYLPPYLLILLLSAPWVMRDRWAWVPLASTGMVGAVLVAETFTLSHYAAPAAAPLVLLFTLSARRLALWRVARARIGVWLVRLCLAFAVASALVAGGESVLDRPRQGGLWPAQRAAMLRRLNADGRRHIVLVSYGPRHTNGAEWVYNRADIEAARVVWARSLGPERDRALLARYAVRTSWRLHVDADDGPLQLVPFAPPPIPPTTTP